MLKNGCILDSSIIEHNGYVYFIGGFKDTPNGKQYSKYITRVTTEDFISYFQDHKQLNDEVVAEFNEDISLTSAIAHDKFIFIIGGALEKKPSDCDYVYDIEKSTLEKLTYKHPGEPCRMNLQKVIHEDAVYIYSFSGFNYNHDYNVYYTRIVDSELTGWVKGLFKIKYAKDSIVYYNYKTHVFELYGGKDANNEATNLYRETSAPFIEVDHVDTLEIDSISSAYYCPYKDGFIIAGGQNNNRKKSDIVYNVRRNEHTAEHEYIDIGNMSRPLSHVNALLIGDTLYVLSGYSNEGIPIENIESIKLDV
jgi:hypothetical protein